MAYLPSIYTPLIRCWLDQLQDSIGSGQCLKKNDERLLGKRPVVMNKIEVISFLLQRQDSCFREKGFTWIRSARQNIHRRIGLKRWRQLTNLITNKKYSNWNEIAFSINIIGNFLKRIKDFGISGISWGLNSQIPLMEMLINTNFMKVTLIIDCRSLSNIPFDPVIQPIVIYLK